LGLRAAWAVPFAIARAKRAQLKPVVASSYAFAAALMISAALVAIRLAIPAERRSVDRV
jgi:hypothetical protein